MSVKARLEEDADVELGVRATSILRVEQIIRLRDALDEIEARAQFPLDELTREHMEDLGRHLTDAARAVSAIWWLLPAADEVPS